MYFKRNQSPAAHGGGARLSAIVLVAAALSIALAGKLPRATAREQSDAPVKQEQQQPQQPQAEKPQSEQAQPDAPQPPDSRPRATTQPSAGADAKNEDADRAVAQAQAKVDASYLEPVLAERLAELAQNRLRQKTVTASMWRQSAALLEASSRLSPRDSRFGRLLIEARLKMQDTDGAIKALTDYRRVDPSDEVAQIQLIDLYVDRMQTVDARLEYLRDLLDRTKLPKAVRSHVAALCVPLLMERSRDDALAMLDQALQSNPVSPEALRLRYDMTGPETAPPQRAAVLLSMLRSNPAQPDIVSEFADLLASVGLAKESVEYYSIALRLYPRLGRAFPEGFVSSVATQLMFTGQNEALETLLSSYLKSQPEDADAWFMRLVKEKAAGEKGNAAALDEARQALTSRWRNVSDRIAGREPQPQPDAQPGVAAPNTGGLAPAGPAPGGPFGGARPGGADIGAAATGSAPATGNVPATAQAAAPANPADTVKRLKAGEGAELAGAFVSSAADLAWLELYFAEKPDAAGPWVAALKDFLSADNVTVVRLEGWLDVLQNRPTQASEKLASIADRDPLAALGLIRLAGKDAGAQPQAQADELSARLRERYPTGLVAAMIWSGLKAQGRDPKLTRRPGAEEVSAELQKFPKDWMEILNQPTAYYKISGEAMKVAHRYGEPMFAKITISNISDYDLTIGPAGVVRPDLWFDARLGGLANQAFPGVAYDRISRLVVLPARTGVQQLVRIDQGELGQALAANPSVSTQVLASVVTNPVSTTSGVGPGPAGHRQALNKALARGGFPLSQTAARKRALATLESGAPGEKMRTLDLFAAFVRLLTPINNIDDATRSAETELAQALNRGRDDKTPVVAAWTLFLTAQLAPPPQRASTVERLVANEDWPARLLGLVAADGMDPDRYRTLAERLAQGDPDPIVKEFAAATVDYLRNPPPAPTTAPAAPAVGAGETAPIPSGLSVPSQSDNAKRGG